MIKQQTGRFSSHNLYIKGNCTLSCCVLKSMVMSTAKVRRPSAYGTLLLIPS